MCFFEGRGFDLSETEQADALASRKGTIVTLYRSSDFPMLRPESFRESDNLSPENNLNPARAQAVCSAKGMALQGGRGCDPSADGQHHAPALAIARVDK